MKYTTHRNITFVNHHKHVAVAKAQRHGAVSRKGEYGIWVGRKDWPSCFVHSCVTPQDDKLVCTLCNEPAYYYNTSLCEPGVHSSENILCLACFSFTLWCAAAIYSSTGGSYWSSATNNLMICKYTQSPVWVVDNVKYLVNIADAVCPWKHATLLAWLQYQLAKQPGMFSKPRSHCSLCDNGCKQASVALWWAGWGDQ